MSDLELISNASTASIPYPDWDPTPPRNERSRRQKTPSPVAAVIPVTFAQGTPPIKGKKRAAQTPLRKDEGKKRKSSGAEDKNGKGKSVQTNKPRNNTTGTAKALKGSKPSPSTSKGKALTGQPTLHAFMAMSRRFEDQVQLSEEQKSVLRQIALRKNVFLTGAAGTGKSVLLKAAIKQLEEMYEYECGAVAVTATTGIAASLLPGVTLHSWAGISNGEESSSKLVKKIQKNAHALFRWESTMALVIDEVSMLDPRLFDKLDAVGRQIRGGDSCFGGIQLILAGDFYQLPPVVGRNEITRFLFDANAWACIEVFAQLTNVYRQADPEFCRMLNQIRIGKIAPDTDIFLGNRLLFKKKLPGPVTPVHLFCTRTEVDKMNRSALDRLLGPKHHYVSVDGGTADAKRRENLLDQLMAVAEVELKVGAQVMLIKNGVAGLVNGTMGVVKEFATQTEWARKDGDSFPSQSRGITDVKYPVVEFRYVEADQTKSTITRLVTPQLFKCEVTGSNGKTVIEASRLQLPLILAWAITVHKAQGQGITHLVVHLERAFQPGQVYVAISRATSLESLQLLGYNRDRVIVEKRVTMFMRKTNWMGRLSS